jgi:hypothetical protein
MPSDPLVWRLELAHASARSWQLLPQAQSSLSIGEMEIHQVHPTQRRVSCELCRKNKVKCQRAQPDDTKCIRCTSNDLTCDSGQQRKVGRPKRKEPASSSAVDKSWTDKRKQSFHPTSTQATVRFTESLDVARSVSAADHLPFHAHAEVRSHVSASISRTRNSGWLQFPTFMTNSWCHENLPEAGRGRIITDAEFCSPSDGSAAVPSGIPMKAHANRAARSITPATLSRSKQPLLEDSVAWIYPEPSIDLRVYGLTGKKQPLPFGIDRPPTYYVHENRFSSTPSDVMTSDVNVGGKGVMARLVRIVQGLRLRSAMVQANRPLVSLNSLVHREGPFFIETYSLCEYVMTATQDLVEIVTILLLYGPQSTCKPDDQSSAHLIPMITDTYCRILSFLQLFLEHLTDRAERQGSDPVVPIPGLTFNGVLLPGPCTQGVLFSSSTFYLLGRLDNVLGLDPMVGGTGLLAAEQIDVLYDKLDRSEDLAQDKGIMRPADVRKLYARVAMVLEQLSTNEY